MGPRASDTARRADRLAADAQRTASAAGSAVSRLAGRPSAAALPLPLHGRRQHSQHRHRRRLLGPGGHLQPDDGHVHLPRAAADAASAAPPAAAAFPAEPSGGAGGGYSTAAPGGRSHHRPTPVRLDQCSDFRRLFTGNSGILLSGNAVTPKLRFPGDAAAATAAAVVVLGRERRANGIRSDAIVLHHLLRADVGRSGGRGGALPDSSRAVLSGAPGRERRSGAAAAGW